MPKRTANKILEESLKIEFPSWEKLIVLTLADYLKMKDYDSNSLNEIAEGLLFKLKALKKMIQQNHPTKVMEFIADVIPDIDEKVNDAFIDGIIAKVAKEWKGHNEFYVLFDIKKGDYVRVDKRIQYVLGIEPSMFNLRSISALVNNCPLYYPDDLSHIVRFAMLAVTSMSMPFIKWNQLVEHYCARYRIGTSMSSIEALRTKGHVVISKMCYVLYHPSDKNPSLPRYHLDRYYVFSDEEIEHPSRSFVSDFEQTIFLNKLNYLFNGYLLGISPKYVCLLDERRIFDRNKAIANSLNQRVLKTKGWDNTFDELQVANCFAKTIRTKIKEAMIESDRFFFQKKIYVQSDQEAVYYATRLGLLPLPQKVKDKIFTNLHKV